jgi:hypothetical protein
MARLCALGPAARKGAVAIAAATALALGCAHSPTVGTGTADFTAESLRSGGLADLGVVQANELAERRPPLVAALERTLAARPDIPFVPAARAQAMMGDSTARLLLLSYELHGVPEAKWLARACDSLQGKARYGILARVESNGIGYARREVPVSSAPDAPVTKVIVAQHQAKVAIIVYHLVSRSVAYRGEFSGESDASVPDTMPRPPSPTPSGNVPPGGAEHPAMERFTAQPPSLASAVQDAFVQFVAELPGKAPPSAKPARPDTAAAAAAPARADTTASAASPPDTTRH